MAKQTDNKIHVPVSIEDGKLTINNAPVEIGSLHFVEKIAEGANGMVFLAIDKLLERLVAVKFWMTLRRSDVRDKNHQGLLEVQKLCSAKEVVEKWKDKRLENPYFIPDPGDTISDIHKIIGTVFFAGFANDYLYTVMEYMKGDSLAMILRTRKDLPFGVKYNFARMLNQYNNVLTSKGIYHGDLHADNVMILNLKKKPSYLNNPPTHTFDMKIIDFGTSFYSSQPFSAERTFKTLQETINKCIAPFRLEDIRASKKPDDFGEMKTWIDQQLNALRAAFYELGEHYVGWPFYLSYGDYQLTTYGLDTSHIRDLIRKKVADGKIVLSKESLGISRDWDTFDGLTAKRGD